MEKCHFSLQVENVRISDDLEDSLK